jgi:type II secretory pathway component PulL
VINPFDLYRKALNAKERGICYKWQMRKILITLALLALSIQTSYATIAGYCQEELLAPFVELYEPLNYLQHAV